MKENLFLKAVSWFAGSADNRPGGASSKKLTAFFTLVVLAAFTQIIWTIWAYKNSNWGHLEYVLSADFVLIVSALGINSNEKIKGKADTATTKEDNQNPQT